MRGVKRWLGLSGALTAVLLSAGVAVSQSVVAVSNAQSVSLTGTSGGTQKDSGCAGFIATTPNHVINITEDSNLKFTLQGSSTATLLIKGDKGENFCVQALPDGKIEIPGRWNRSKYSVFVGERNQGRNPYVLSIDPI
jgi:hypothetical protein